MKEKSKFKFREIIDLLIEFVYLTTIFVVPLYFSYLFPTYNIFEFAKLIIFQVLVYLLLFLTLLKIFYFSALKFHWVFFKKYFLLPLIFILGLGVTVFFSTNQTQSLFGSYDRQAGFFSFLFYFLWFTLLVYNVRTVNNQVATSDSADTLSLKIKRIIKTILLSSFLVSLYGILQILGIDFLSWPEDPLLTQRTISTFGQPNFLASWLLLVIPLSVYEIYQPKNNLLKFSYFLVLVSQITCLFFTASRGAVLALAISLFLFVIYFVFFTKLKKTQKIISALGLLFIMLFSFWSLNTLVPGRMTSLLDLKNGSMAARVNFYSAAAEAVKGHSLFGYGLENSGEVFIRYYEPDWGIYGDVASTTDRAHNLILDIVLSTGFFGLALFTLLYYLFFHLAKDNIILNRNRPLSLALAFGGSAYLLSLMFSFAIVGGEVYFWLFLALLAVINYGHEREFERETQFKKKKLGLKIIILCIFLGTSYLIYLGVNFAFRSLSADQYFNQLYYTLGKKEYFSALTLADYIDEEKINPVMAGYYNRFLADKLSDFYPGISNPVDKKISADKLSQLDLKLPTQGYENLYVKGKINSVLGNDSLSESYFRQVISETPYWPKTYLELAKLFAAQNNFKSALLNYNLALSTLPNVDDERLNPPHKHILNLYRKLIYREIGDIYFSFEDYAAAEENYQLAYRADISDFTLLKKIADTYYMRQDFASALQYNLRGAARNTSDFNWPLAIASIYKEMGNKKMARNYYQQALILSPAEPKLLKLANEFK